MTLALIGLVISVGIWLYAVIDVLTAEPEDVRMMPKGIWILIVVCIPKFGGIAWWLLGRPQKRPMYSEGHRQTVSNASNLVRDPYADIPEPQSLRETHKQVKQQAMEEEMFRRQFRERVEKQRRSARDKDLD